ncbi:MAG: response regulator transcription factor [Desulfobacteraceae bacterium]|nr:response regulator transcription factor [Desulfobacteraceae bacterium]
MNEKILVMDDEEDILFVIESYLTRQGFKVRTASNGLKGIELFLADPAQKLRLTNLIRQGRTSKEIAEVMGCQQELLTATGTVSVTNQD